MISATKPYAILLIEDNEADVALVREALRRHAVRCTVQEVHDGAEAIELIKGLDRNPKGASLDLVILDMHLPKRDGVDILKCLRGTEHYGQIPVIVMTGFDSTDFRRHAMKYAALTYFRKPTTLSGFMEIGSIARDLLSARDVPFGPTAG